MPKSPNRSNKIPKFVKTLNHILEDKNCAEIICQLPQKNGFQILNTSRFIEQVLPTYFKHKNMASFVRQLNMYGFNRPRDTDQHVYTNPRFIKGNFNSMRQIQRKTFQKVSFQQDGQSSQQIIQSEYSNQDLSQICKKLFEENKQLRKMNQQLNKKLQSFKTNKLQVQGAHSGSESTCNIQIHNVNEIFDNKQSYEQQKLQRVDDKKKIGFHFGQNQQNWSSKLSYLSLIRGAQDQQMC